MTKIKSTDFLFIFIVFVSMHIEQNSAFVSNIGPRTNKYEIFTIIRERYANIINGITIIKVLVYDS